MSQRTILLWVLVAIVAVGLIFTGHGPHVVGYLPFLILLACPLMHMFMHHGHGGHDAGHRQESPPTERTR